MKIPLTELYRNQCNVGFFRVTEVTLFFDSRNRKVHLSQASAAPYL